jgi:hypothetical protein
LATSCDDQRLIYCDGIYELRATTRGIQLPRAVLLSQADCGRRGARVGVKESTVPDRDIDLAIRRKKLFEANPLRHTLEEN